MTYEFCCAKISVVVYSSSTRRRPSSPKALESPRVSKLTSSSSTCLAPVGVSIFTVSQTEKFGGKQTKKLHFPPLEKTPSSAHRTPVVTPATP